MGTWYSLGNNKGTSVVDGWNVLTAWFAYLFNPPPLVVLTQGQKIARSFLVALGLFSLCIGAATFAAIGLYLAGQARAMASDGTAMPGLSIVLVAAGVNALCVRAVLAIKRSA